MGKRLRVIIAIVVLLLVAALITWLVTGANVAVLNPKGAIAEQQLDLIILSTALMLLIVVPVFVLTFYIVWKYRASNTKANYQPEWDRNHKLETAWWGLPLLIIALLSVVIWKSSHELDPYKPLARTSDPITIQVVALQWKWLFFYPEQGIATVNFIQFPEDTPINFEITADAPMNSFWIPSLGGQVYAMAGMETKLHLEASETGDYEGVSANISGEGFSGMRFTATASSRDDFNQWVSSVKQSKQNLAQADYEKLLEPSKNVEPVLYANYNKDLYDTIIMKYMKPGAKTEGHNEHAH